MLCEEHRLRAMTLVRLMFIGLGLLMLVHLASLPAAILRTSQALLTVGEVIAVALVVGAVIVMMVLRIVPPRLKLSEAARIVAASPARPPHVAMSFSGIVVNDWGVIALEDDVESRAILDAHQGLKGVHVKLVGREGVTVHLWVRHPGERLVQVCGS